MLENSFLKSLDNSITTVLKQKNNKLQSGELMNEISIDLQNNLNNQFNLLNESSLTSTYYQG